MSELLASPLILILLVLLASVIGIVGGGLLAQWVLKKKQGYPYEVEIEKALRPFALKAIMLAYKTSEVQVDKLGKRLLGIDKKLVAVSIYNMLPDEIAFPLPRGETLRIPIGWVKVVFSEEDFAELIEDAFSELEDFLKSTKGKFGEAVEELLGELK